MSTIIKSTWVTGYLFQNDSDELLINLPSKKMSLNLEDDLEFWHWYQQQNIFSYENLNIYQDLFLATI